MFRNTEIDKEFIKKVTELFDNTALEAQQILSTIGNNIDNWWKNAEISLAHKVLMKWIIGKPEWIQDWNNFKKGQSDHIRVPLLVVPGKSEIGPYNLILQTNEAPTGRIFQGCLGHDSRNTVRSLESNGLGGSVLIFHDSHENEQYATLEMLHTNQVQMVIIAYSRCLYEQYAKERINNFLDSHKKNKPHLAFPCVIPDEYYKPDWFNGISYYFTKPDLIRR